MSIKNPRELAVTKKKLNRLEERIDQLDSEPVSKPQTRELTRRSLKRLINQMKEEIVLYSARQATPKS